MPGEFHIRGKYTRMIGRRKNKLSCRLPTAHDGAQFSYILQLSPHHKNTIMQAKFYSEVILTDFRRCCADIQHVTAGIDPITSGNLCDCIGSERTATIF